VLQAVRAEQSRNASGLQRTHPPGERKIQFILRQTLKKQLFVPLKSIICNHSKKIKSRLKQRLFLGNAMRPKEAYFAQDERDFS